MSAADASSRSRRNREPARHSDDDARRHLWSADFLRDHLSDSAGRDGDDLAEAARRGDRRQHVRAAASLTFEPWIKAWGEARIGVSDTAGHQPAISWNSIKMVVPAVLISTVLGALNGYVLTKWRFPGHALVFGLMLFACFIPFQSVIIPMAVILGALGHFGNQLQRRHRLLVRPRQFDRQSGDRPRGLRPRLHHAVLPQLLRGVPDRTRQGGDDRRRRLLPDLPPHSAAEFDADLHRHRDLPVHQHLERLPVRLDLRRRRFLADDGRAQQSRQHLDGRNVEYNVNMAAAIIAAAPTLVRLCRRRAAISCAV